MPDILPPSDLPMERAVIGCLLQKSELIDECISRFKVGAEVFFDLRNRRLYRVLVEMRQSGQPIDQVTVFSKLTGDRAMEDIGGVAYLARVDDGAVASNFEFYADCVSEAYMLRRAVTACTEAVGEVYENRESANVIIAGIENKLAAIRDLRGGDEIISSHQAATLLNLHLEEKFNLQGKRSGIATGLYDFDNLTDGLQFGELAIIGARPSQGKTALATTIVHFACILHGVPALFVTLEMSIPALCRRLLSRHCEIGMKELRSGRFGESEFGHLSAFNQTLADAPIFFLDSIGGTNVSRIVACIRRVVKSSGVRLVVVDYLQKIHAVGKHEKRTYEVAEVSTALKAVAVETGAAILALAQLNREPDKEKTRLPRISDLADSAQIERDADLIGLLHRDRSENGGRDSKLIIAKQRDGEIGTCEMNFEARYASFENSEPKP